MLAALIVAPADARRLAAVLRRVGPVVWCRTAHDLLEAAGTVDAVLMEPVDQTGAAVSSVLPMLRARAPHLPLIAYVSLNAPSVRALAQLAEHELHAVVIRGVDDDPASLRRVIDTAAAQACEAHLWERLATHVPVDVQPILKYCVAHSSSPVRVSSLALAVGLPERTLNARLHRAGLPGAKDLIAWCRLVRVACLLHDNTLTLENIATRLHFPSAAAIHTLVTRLLGKSPGELRRSGAATSTLVALQRRLATSRVA